MRWPLILGVPLLGFVLIPFPFGCGMIYPIEDSLRGHPEGPHGTQPKGFAGLWIRDEPVPYDFVGQAFYLMPNGRLLAPSGMTERRWHFDDHRFFVDSRSLCGNCYRGNVTAEYTVKFVDPDHLLIANRDKGARRGIGGSYHRFEVTPTLRSRMDGLKDSPDEAQSFNARMVSHAIE